MPPIKILHLVTSLDRGGAQAMLARLVTRTDRSRFASVVVSMIDGGGYRAELDAAGIPVHGLGMRRGWPSTALPSRLRRIVDSERPDLLLSWLYHADVLSLFAAGAAPGLQLLWNLRASDVELGVHLRAVRRLLALASRRPAAVLVNSEAGRRFHARLGYHPRRWEVVPNGFDTALFHPDPAARAQWRGRLGLGETAPLIGMVARAHRMKDYPTFLAAAERIGAARAEAAFLVVGAGTERLPVPLNLRGRLHALGERDRMHEILPALDLMLLSSRFGEGFPNVIGEAMACGVAAIATDVGDTARIIDDTGRVVPPGDPAALAAAALDLLALGPAGLARLGLAAARRVAQHYSIEAAVAHYERIFVEIASASG